MRTLSVSHGFSLIELLLVVTIMGILASIGITSYESMLYNTRKNQAKSNMILLYNGMKSFHTEWNQYFGDWNNIGVQLNGDIYYRVGFNINSPMTSPVAPDNYIGPGVAAGERAAAISSNPESGVCVYNGDEKAFPCVEIVPKVCGLWSSSFCRWDNNPDTFGICGCSFVRDSGGTVKRDRWWIDQTKTWGHEQI